MPLTIVAEIGSNWYHPDKQEAKQRAIDHIQAAARCGATAVKFQLFRADSLYSQTRAPEQYENIKKFELPIGWYNDLLEEAHQNELEFWITPFAPELARQVALSADVVKIASGDITYLDLLGSCKTAQKIAMSTGAANSTEVLQAIEAVDGVDFLLYCVSNYPAPEKDYHLGRFPWSDLVGEMGVSDHTTGHYLLRPALAQGYRVFEKHFKLPHTLPESPDYEVSMGPAGFRVYCEIAKSEFDNRYRRGFGVRADENERLWSRRGADGLRPAGEANDLAK